jgi:crotonobetainyl-CoA:carnitine CoA-transferase CaiB-like acyl-CoA transferase
MGGPLAGVRVIDLGRLMPSSIATLELAVLGAEVIKVELPPHGDYLRINPPFVGDRGDMHLHINRGKKSVRVDLRMPEGRAALDRLLAASDVLVELGRPGAGQAFGLDPARVRQLNPRLVHCSMTGFGFSGPYADLGAHGLSADAAAGLLRLERDGDRWLLPDPYVSVGPRASGLYAAIAILAALYEARSTGVGRFLDVSQWDAAIAWNYRELVLSANGVGHVPSYRDLGPKYDVYETADGSWVLLCAPEPKLFRALCAAVGRDDLAGPDTDEVVQFHDDDGLRAELRDVFRQRTRDEWLDVGRRSKVPIAPVVQREELATDPHVVARGMVTTEVDPSGVEVRLPGFPVKGLEPDERLAPAPELGQHTVEVLESLGYSESEIEDLADRRVAW